MSQLGIVVCNYNKKCDLRKCLSAVFKDDLDRIEYEVIVVDNASTDGSVEMVRALFPAVTIIEKEQNTGAPVSFATGMHHCLEQNHEFVLLLDDDATVKAGAITNLMTFLLSNQNCGCVGAKIIQADNPDYLQEQGALLTGRNLTSKLR